MKLTTKSAPRDLPALLALSRQQRLVLFTQILDEDKTLTAKQKQDEYKTFDTLGDEDQAMQLSMCLVEMETPSGYVVHGIALPVRSNKSAVNERRFTTFAKEVEDALNAFKEMGTNSTATTHFNEHGILIVGFKSDHPLFPGAILGPIPGVPESEPPHSKAMHHKVRNCLMELQAQQEISDGRSHITDKKIDEAVNSHFRNEPAENLRQAIESLKHYLSTHNAEHGHTDCPFSACCMRIHEKLEQKLQQSLS